VVKPGSPTVRVDMQPGTLVPPAAAATRSGNEVAGASALPSTGESVEITTDTRQALASRPVRPEYPLLARQMKVQGEVVLDAWIGQDGGIKTLSVVGGPSILADAAQTAVRQWRFKPHYEDGQPVATQARIAVDFTIRRTDN
jgi:TonB family protein